jgi:coenzyme PQQ biosynthesis protein PqqD
VSATVRRLRLATRARLHFDRHAGEWVLLYPERGLTLNRTAVEIVRLLTGEHTLDTIVARVAADVPLDGRGTVARDVERFVDALAARCLLEDAE